MVSIPENLAQFVKEKITKCANFEIRTYTVIPTDENGKDPKKYSYNTTDDNTYVKYPELIKIIPRGLSVAFLDGNMVCKLDGLEKFDGSCPLDDDDDDEFSSNIFKQNSADIANWKNLKVEFLEKANGKMAIFKIFKIKEKYFILGGSKNIHIIVGIDEDIKGTELHHQILKQFQKDLKNHVITDITNHTIVAEYVDGQHIVHVDKPYLIYFSGPMININRLMPDQNTIPTTEQLQTIRYLENTEGAVIVYTNLDNGTIFRQKHKTIWYILIRVMREGLRHFTKQINTDIIINKVFCIFKKRSTDFLALSEGDFAKWYILLRNFVLFIKQSIYNFFDLDFQKLGIGAIWYEFTKCDPSILLKQCLKEEKEEEYQEPLLLPQLREYVYNLYNNGIKICVIMRGPTGSGKSQTINVLKKTIDIRCFSTDDLFMTDGDYKFDPSKLKLFHGQNFQNFTDAITDNIQSICVDNTNIDYHEYGRYIELARNNGYVTIGMDCKKLTPDVLMARSTHAVPINRIIAKVKKYKYIEPVYYGVFFNDGLSKTIFSEIGFRPVQKTPLHITLFFGHDQINSLACKSIPMGKEFTVKVLTFCTNRAGKFLKVSIDDFEFDQTHLHITLETHEDFKPVDVGMARVESSVEINKEIKGIFGPIF